MSTAVKVWFEIERKDCPNDNAWEFMVALCSHATEWMTFGIPPENGFFQTDGDLITVGISIHDREKRGVLRELRIDFYGTRMVMGEDETHQYVTELDSETQGVIEHKNDDASPTDYAEFAAKWLAVEMARPIERYEWIKLFYRHTKYVMVDTGICIIWSDTKTKERFNLGPPSRVNIVHPVIQETGTCAS